MEVSCRVHRLQLVNDGTIPTQLRMVVPSAHIEGIAACNPGENRLHPSTEVKRQARQGCRVGCNTDTMGTSLSFPLIGGLEWWFGS